MTDNILLDKEVINPYGILKDKLKLNKLEIDLFDRMVYLNNDLKYFEEDYNEDSEVISDNHNNLSLFLGMFILKSIKSSKGRNKFFKMFKKLHIQSIVKLSLKPSEVIYKVKLYRKPYFVITIPVKNDLNVNTQLYTAKLLCFLLDKK